MPIGRNFHVIHMTDDLKGLDAWYDDVFSPLRFMNQTYMEAEKRDASLVLVGGLCIEPLAPAFHVEGWDEKPLGRFFRRFGHRWHSIAWYVEPPDSFDGLYRVLRDRGVRLYGTAGKFPHNGKVEEDGALFIHPRDAVTQLEFYPAPHGDSRLFDPRFAPGFNPAWWTEVHPLEIRQTSHVTLAVRDMERAREFYVNGLGGRVLSEEEVTLTGTKSTFVAVGTDLVLELAEPIGSDSMIARDLEERFESLYAVTFKVRDIDRAEKYLDSKGVRAALRDATTLVSDPATTQGVVMGFTSADLPNDSRKDWSPYSA